MSLWLLLQKPKQFELPEMPAGSNSRKFVVSEPVVGTLTEKLICEPVVLDFRSSTMPGAFPVRLEVAMV
jgi:hypothetical protein